jgi:hypothetical protein
VTEATVRRATEGELAEVGALIGLSFDDLVQCAFLVPRPADRLRVMSDYFAMLTEHAFRYGKVDMIGNGPGLHGAAVWFDHTSDTPEPPDYEHRLATLTGGRRSSTRTTQPIRIGISSSSRCIQTNRTGVWVAR